MDAQLDGDRLNEERAFIKRYTEGLTSHPVEYPADFSTPLEDRPRKVPAVQVPIADPPEVMDVDGSIVQDTSITLTIKSLKPSLTFTIKAQTTDTVFTLKEQVAKSNSSAPSVETQRLLLKGKALTDSKLLKEYDITDGATVHLLLKPSSPAVPTTMPTTTIETSSSLPPPPTTRHMRTASDPAAFALNDKLKASSTTVPPSLVITTSLPNPSGSPRSASPVGSGGESDEITTTTPLRISDTSVPPLGPQPIVSSAEFHSTISNPAFWSKIHQVCKDEFIFEDDADTAWETFLVAMKSRLSAGEAAKIRDVVGIAGMGGGA